MERKRGGGGGGGGVPYVKIFQWAQAEMFLTAPNRLKSELMTQFERFQLVLGQ